MKRDLEPISDERYDEILAALTENEHRDMCELGNFLRSLDPAGTDIVLTNKKEIKDNTNIASLDDVQRATQILIDLHYLRVTKCENEKDLYEIFGAFCAENSKRIQDAIIELRNLTDKNYPRD